MSTGDCEEKYKCIVQILLRTLKRELENSAKNCRVLQFKLKKTEKSLNDTQSDLGEAESKLKSLSGGSNALDSINKVGQTVEQTFIAFQKEHMHIAFQ